MSKHFGGANAYSANDTGYWPTSRPEVLSAPDALSSPDSVPRRFERDELRDLRPQLLSPHFH